METGASQVMRNLYRIMGMKCTSILLTSGKVRWPDLRVETAEEAEIDNLFIY